MSFKTANEIRLQPGDTIYSVAFKFPVSSSATLNDGTLPYNTSIASVDVTGWYGDISASDLLNGLPTISGTDTVQVNLDYPSTTMSGVNKVVNMSLKFILTLNTTATLVENFNSVVVQ